MRCLARVINGDEGRRYVARLRHPTLKRAVAQFLTPDDLEDEEDPVWTVEWWPSMPPGNEVVKVVAEGLQTIEDVRKAMRHCEAAA